MKIVPIQEVENRLVFRFFNCGNDDLNAYFSKYAYANDRVNISKTYVCIDDDGFVIGFYTLCVANVMNANLPNSIKIGLPKYPCPCAKIARLAVDIKYQKQHYGKRLLKDALEKIIIASNTVGIFAVLVDAKEESKSFYEHYHFIKLNAQTNEYMLPISVAIKALMIARK